ncbi:MAG: NPCBM/NEW2 domain-containing protein, partial [Planctomycetota bacterium]
MAIRGIVRWGDFRQPARGPYLVLADGGVLPGDPFEADGKKLALDTNTFGLLTLPVEQVAGIVFSTPPRQQAHDKLYLSLLDVTERSDLLLLENGDRVSGLFLGIDADVIRFRSNLGEFEASFRRVTAVVLNPALRKRPPAEGLRLWAGFADGSRLLSSALTTEGNALRVGSSAGELSALLTKLTALQPLGGRPVYLSELDPADYRQIPYLDLAWPFTHDRSVGGGLLRPGNPAAPGQIALKGLAVHSAGRLSYDVSAGFERFEAELAIDAAAPEGSVRFRIFADGQPRFASGDIRGGMPPVAVSVP